MKINEVLIYVILLKIYFVNLNRNINGRMFYYFIFRGSFLYNLVCFEFRCNVIVMFFLEICLCLVEKLMLFERM